MKMTTNGTEKSLAAIVTWSLMLSMAYSAAAHSHISLSTKATPITSQSPDVHAIKDAGLQFELPKGWKAETQESGNILVSFEDGAASATFVVEDRYTDVVSGMKNGLKEQLTDLKSDGEPKENTHNGMGHISESGSGLLKGVLVTWSIDVLKAGKNVTILTFGIDTILAAHAAEYKKFVNSIKKI
jgi:hypothetical protein